MLQKLALLGQMKSMGGRTLRSLTATEIGMMVKGLGLNIHITDELKAAGMALLAGQSIDTVADLINDPESIHQLVSLFQNGVGKQEPTEAEQQVAAMTLSLF